MSVAGALLVANPLLADGNFERSVVLVVEHDDNGALGVVLNRPSDISLHDILVTWAPLATAPAVFFFGGPVSPQSVICLGMASRGHSSGRRVFGDVVTVDLEPGPGLTPEITTIRAFAGYAGWAPSQLDEELADQGWLVVPAVPSDVFTADPATLWSRVLRRQDDERALLSTYPRDIAVN